ncbi:hypothetical protein BZZ01_31825 [Nostocales cyanobacterium HT-58-2]|nr:hypothetical protein BZZ01_31825 [Nostocales cyanobacterium HT-58-2]
MNAEKVLAAPLPDDVGRSVIAPAFALQEHPSIDNGRLETFAHLFDQQLLDNQLEANFVAVSRDDSRLRSSLAELLQIPETELPKRLKEIGQELAFYFAVNPQLYQQFAEALRSKKAHSTLLPTESLPESSKPNNLEQTRQILLSQGVSEVLKTKLE